MLYLTVQTLALLLIAIAIGAGIGWLLRGARDSAANEARAANDAARIADLRRDRDAAEAALSEAKAAPAAPVSSADDGQFAELQGALDACRESVSALEAERDAALAAQATAEARADAAPEATTPKAAVQPAAAAAAPSVTAAPGGAAVGAPDDLKQISGIGPKLEGVLREAGITRFEQIANLSLA
jgi:NADH-quinone oxidoreductase subunit E